MRNHQRRPDPFTTEALRLALVPGWDPRRSAERLVDLAAGNPVMLRRSLARLEVILLERHSDVVQRAASAVRLALGAVEATRAAAP